MSSIAIFGAGLSGISLSSHLLDKSDHQIHLYDSDSLTADITEAHTSAPFSEVFGDIHTNAYGFGGTTQLWHGVMTKLDLMDLNCLDNFMPKSILEDFFPDNVDLRLFPHLRHYHPQDSTSSTDNSQSEQLRHRFNKLYPVNTETLVKTYTVPAKPPRLRQSISWLTSKYPGRLILHEEIIALKLLISRDASESARYIVSGIRCLCQEKIVVHMHDYFVLCMGALETPRLLLNSDPSSAYFGDHLGLHLMDHPNAAIGYVTLDKPLYGLHAKPTFFRSSVLRHGITFANGINGRNISLMFPPKRESIRDILKGKSPTFVRSKSIAGASVPFLLSKARLPMRSKEFFVWLHHEVLPTDGGSVRLSTDVDQYSRHDTHLTYPSLDSFYSVAEEISMTYSREKSFSNYQPFLCEDISLIPGSHYSGTCRISKDISQGVVSSDMRCHQFKNLFISDTSVLPRIGNSNLSLSILLIVKHLASHLRTL